MTSMERLLGREIDMAEVEDRIEANFRDVFEYGVRPLGVNCSSAAAMNMRK